jgi:hypothetical protein
VESSLDKLVRSRAPSREDLVRLAMVRSYARYERGKLERVAEHVDSRRAHDTAHNTASRTAHDTASATASRDAKNDARSVGGRGVGVRLRPWDAVRAGQLLFHGGNLFHSLGNSKAANGGTAPGGAAASTVGTAASTAASAASTASSNTNGAVTFGKTGWTPGPSALPSSLALQQSILGGRTVAPGTPMHTATIQHAVTGKKHTITLPSDHKVTVVAGKDDTKPGSSSLPVM